MGILARRTRRKWLAGLVANQDWRDDFGQSRYEVALDKLRNGYYVRWYEYVFPITLSADEARAYAKDRTLGYRLRESFQALVGRVRAGQTVRQVFGEHDGMKVLASLSLFCEVDSDFTELRRQLSVATLAADRVRRQREQENRDSTHGYN
jgi:uncharacterized protein (DUF1810 family)